MEGDGEGVVAVVRGSKHALTVTLLADSHRASPRKCVDSNWESTRVSHSSAETNTERNFGNDKVPIYDVRYASSFGFTDYQSTFTAIPQHISSMFKCPDLFTQSLRKYPNDGSSAEFIQRIIDYTQSRKYARKHYPRSLRTSSRKKGSQMKDANNYNNRPKGNEEQNTRSISNNDLSQNELVKYTYDYLKSSSVPRNTHVRYLTEMKRAIRGQLRCMIDEEPTVCPRMRSRYSHHRRHYHDKNELINKDGEIEEARRNAISETKSISLPRVQNDESSNIASCQTTCKSCLPSCDWDVRHSEQFSIKSQDTEVQKLVNEINDWLNTIPVNENFSRSERIRREELTRELAKTLKSIRKDVNFPTLAKKEVIKYLDMLPMWRPGDSEYEVILVERIIDDLIKRLKNLAEADFKMAISEEVNSLPFDTELLKENIIRETKDTFVDKLRAVALKRPFVGDEEYRENLKSEVINIIKDLPLQLDKQSEQQILSLAEEAVERLHQNNIFKVDSKQTIIENIKKTLFDWCTEVPELSNHSPAEYSDLIQLLADKLYAYEACDITDDHFVKELREELEEWLDNVGTKLNTNFNSGTKYKLSNKLIERLLGASVIEHVIKWFKNIPDLSIGNSIEMNRALKNIALQLKEILIHHDNVENVRSEMKDTISKWLIHILQAQDIELDSKAQDNLVNDLILTLTDVPTRKKEQLHSDVVTWLKEIPSMKRYDNFDANDLVTDFVIRLMEIQTTNDEDAIELDIENEIETFVEQLSKANDTNITSDYIDELKSTLLTRLKALPKHKQFRKQFLVEKISNIVESCAMLPKERKEILKHKILSAILKNITDTSIHSDNFFETLATIVTQETQLNKNDIETIVYRITERINNLLFNETEEKVCDRQSQDYNNSTSYNSNLAILKNIDLASQNFDQKIEERITGNIPQAINGLKILNTIQTNKSIGNGNEQSILDNFSTSTPVDSFIKHPSDTFTGIPANISNGVVNKSNLTIEESSEHSQYLNELKTIIRNWLNRFDVIINENEKNKFIDSIASDIINRQKYLKFSDTNKCDKDELEHLKYQTFKRLQNIIDQEILQDIISNVNSLYQIISLKTNQRIPECKPDETTNLQMSSLNADCISQKITKCYEQCLPPCTWNNKCDKAMIEELARKLEMLKTNGNYDSVHIKKEIYQWLASIPNNVDRKKINDFTESLTTNLNDTCAETQIPLQDTSEFIFENLSSAIIDWFRTSQYRNEIENKIQQYLASILAYDIKQVFANSSFSSGEEINTLLIEEIIKNLRKVTGDLEDSALRHYACDLLKYLKDLKLFCDISDRIPSHQTYSTCRVREDDDVAYKYEIKQAVIEWLNNLPLQECKKIEDILDSELQNFVDGIVKYSELNILKHENLLREHIIRFLSKIPLRVNEQGYSGIEDQAAALTTMLKDIYVQMKLATAEKITHNEVNESSDVIYKQLLHDTISKTFLEKCTTEEQLSLNLLKEKLAYAFIDLYSLTDDEEMRIKIKNKLFGEINKFCDDYLKCRYALHLHGDEIQENLHKVLLNVSLPMIKSNLDIHRDKISEEIRKWVKGTPVCDVMISILANRIYPILNEPELLNENLDKIRNEIIKWLQSLQLKLEEVLALDETTDYLIDNLKVLAKIENVKTNELFENNTHASIDSQYIQNASNTLRTDEIDHLKRIRARSDIHASRNASLTTSADIGIQTDINYNETGVQTNMTTQESSINKVTSPQVIVKEYYWDSIGSQPSYQTLSSPAISPERGTIVRTNESQTDSYSKYEIKSPSISKSQNLYNLRGNEVSRKTDTNTRITNDRQRQRGPSLKSRYCQASIPTPLETPKCQKNSFCKIKRNIDCRPHRKTLESDMIHNIVYEDECRSRCREPKTSLSDKLSPVIITEKTNERRCYVSPECINIRKSKGDNSCCNCKNNLHTKCRNKSHNCQRKATNSNLKQCSQCFGGHCPHPSYFFFKRDL